MVSEKEFIFVFFMILLIPFFPFLIAYILDKKKSKNKIQSSSVTSFEKELAGQVEEFLPDFDIDVFKEYTYHLFESVQKARSSFDYDTIRRYTTDALYKLYHAELLSLKKDRKKKIIKNMNLLNFELVGLKIINQKVSLKANLTIKCYDYIEDEESKIVNGTKKIKKVYTYEIIFMKKKAKKVEDNCPNCSAPIKDCHSMNCPYCGTIINHEFNDWKLVKIKEV